MKKLFMILNTIMLVFTLIFDVLYMINGGLLLKSIASIMFVLTGVINISYCIKNKTNLKFPIWMLVALICAMLGDILLNINFYIGTIIFAVAHVFYFISYCMLQKMNRRDILCGIGIFIIAISIILFTPFLNFEATLMKGICCFYALIISFMVGKAISNILKENSFINIIIMIGSILFFISDFMLLLNKFGNIAGTNYLCLGTYYPAQFLLAFSILTYAGMNFFKKREV